jgi:endonuclease/exonuclease/phosphatase family metal-dependent hydrolase
MRPFYRLLTVVLCAFATTSLQGQVSLFQINSPYQQNFDSLLSAGTANEFSSLPHGWLAIETGTNANTSYAASTGSANAGNTYSFGTTAERALGGLQSGSLIPIVGAEFVNNTGATITALQISYKGEQWRLGATSRPDRIDFQFSLNAIALNAGTWNDIDALDFNSPISSGTVGALNGNDSLNNSSLTSTIEGLTIAPGSTFYIRWTDFNASGADDGLAVDDFSITPIGVDPGTPSMTFTPASLNFNEVNVGTSDTLRYRVITSNLNDSIAVFTFRPEYSLSIDGIHFGSSITLSPTGGSVIVKFTPPANGIVTDSALHINSSLSKSLSLSGKGFVQAANIIPISAARTMPIGTRVTVAGRVTVGNELGNPVYIQDVTGGIPVFDYAMASAVKIGDSVIVTGPIGVFSNQIQISGSNIIFNGVSGTTIIPEPKIIAASDLAAYEGQLVTVQHVHLVNTNFVFYPQSTEVLTNDTLSIDLRIDGDTDIPGLTKPQGIVDITGVVGRFKTNAQLLPRFREDIPGASDPALPSDSIPKNQTLDIVNWNLEFFGATRERYPEEYGPANEALQLQNVRKVLDSLQADIIAVQEISDDSTFAALVSQLGHYKAVCSDRYSYSFEGPSNTFPPQKICYLYDTLTVRELSSRPLFEQLYDSARRYDGSLLPGYPGGSASSFYSSGRLPYLLHASLNIEGVETTITLINIHAKSGATAGDRERRAYDAQVLKDSIDAYHANANLIILGDFNDDLDKSIAAGLASPYAGFVADSLAYDPVTKALSDAGARSTVSFSDVIDHQILSNELSTQYLTGTATIATPFGMIANYANTTSDHLPVITRYKLKPSVINFVSAGATLLEGDTTAYRVTLRSSKSFSQPKSIAIRISGSATIHEDYHTSTDSLGTTIYVPIAVDSAETNFDITVIDDTWDENAEAAIFTILPGSGFVAGDSSTFILTIEDNDIPTISFAQIIASGYEGAGDQKITLNLSVPVATTQEVILQVTNALGAVYGTDYVTTPPVTNNKISLTIPAGNDEAVFVITPLADAKRELGEVVVFKLASVSSGLAAKSPTASIFTILDSRLRNIILSIAPNPTFRTAKLVVEGIEPTETVSLELRTWTGELILHVSDSLEKVNEIFESKTQGVAKGIYFVKVKHGGETYLLRMVKS